MTDLRMIRVTPEVMDRWWTRDHDGNRLRVEWGEPDTAGFYEPAISVDYTDNIHAADKATIATLRAALDATTEALWDACDCPYHGQEDAYRKVLDNHQPYCNVAQDPINSLLRAALTSTKETP